MKIKVSHYGRMFHKKMLFQSKYYIYSDIYGSRNDSLFFVSKLTLIYA